MSRRALRTSSGQVLAGVDAEVLRLPTADVEPADTGVGSLELLPTMHWLREQAGPISGFHQSMLVQVPAALGLHALRAVVQAVLNRHDALRMRLTSGTRGWSVEVMPPSVV